MNGWVRGYLASFDVGKAFCGVGSPRSTVLGRVSQAGLSYELTY